MNNLDQLIAQRLKVNHNIKEQWQNIPCPFHKDGRPSAAVLFKQNGDIILNCLAQCGAFGKSQIANKLGIVSNTEQIDTSWLLPVAHRHNQVNQNLPRKLDNLKMHIKEYADFIVAKGLDPDLLDSYGAEYISDQNNPLFGYVKWTYGRRKDHYVARRILNHEPAIRPRFMNGETKEINLSLPVTEQDSTKLLFGAEYIRHEPEVILCEGLTDYFSLIQMGYKNCCASLGATVNEAMLIILRNKTVFILYDTDYAGWKGAKNASDILKRFNSNPIILEIPSQFIGEEEDKADINSAYCKDKEGLKTWLHLEMSKYKTFDNEYIKKLTVGSVESVKYYSSGISQLDSVLSGGYASGVHIMGGEPGSGKSTKVSHDIDNFVRQGARVLVATYELPIQQIYSRVASRHSKLTWTEIEKDIKNLDEETRLYLQTLAQRTKVVNDWTLAEITHASNQFDVIIVDYIQRMRSDKQQERDRIRENMYGLGDLAVQKNKIVMIMSQLNRSSYGGDTTLKSFMQDSSIEAVSQTAMILSKFNEQVHRIQVLKNTRGRNDIDLWVNIDMSHQRIGEAHQVMDIFNKEMKQ